MDQTLNGVSMLIKNWKTYELCILINMRMFYQSIDGNIIFLKFKRFYKSLDCYILQFDQEFA